MSLLARILREPLFHFLLIGGAVFVAYALVTGEQASPPRERIVVTAGRVQQLAEVFTRTWQRPPTTQELRGLVEAYIKEEVYYREALKLGLDRNDTLIRRRMQQKMEFLTEPSDDILTPTETELQDFLTANLNDFRSEPAIAFQQIYINPQNAEPPVETRVAELLDKLRGRADPRTLGDRTMLPFEMPITSIGMIGRQFGGDFAKKLEVLPVDEWAGPVKSPFGLHLVRITERAAPRDPPLSEIREAVELRWRAEKRDAFRKAEYERLRSRYEVILSDPSKEFQTARSPL